MADRYRLEHQVAAGGMAEVYLGVARGAEGFEKQVAIKRIHPHLAQNPQVAAMFLAEARVARHLHHQNIVEVLDVGKSSDGLYLVMELIDGWSVAEILDRAIVRGVRFPPPLAAFVALQAATGLAHAYGRSEDGKRVLVAHRDISPSNILISAEGEVKVADFGIAKLAVVSTATEPGTFKGKVDYASPEVLQGEAASSASDQFALGVVLYEMLAGCHPFGDTQHLMVYVQALRTQAPPPLPAACGPLAGIVNRLLAKAPSGRFATQDDLLRALASYLAICGVPTSSGEVARFVASLQMPPSFAHRTASSDAATGPSSFSLAEETPAAPSAGGPGLASRPMSTPWGEFEIDADWEPSGQVMDDSGQLSEASPSKAPPPPTQAMPARVKTAPPPPVAMTPSAPVTVIEAPLELAHDPRRSAPPSDPEIPEFGEAAPPPKKRSRLGLAIAAVTLLLGASVLAVFFLVPSSHRYFTALGLKPGPKRVLYLDSYPPGATIWINGNEVGQTPFIQHNEYPPGVTIEFQMTLTGYKKAQGTFPGGEGVERLVTLSR